MNDPNNRISSSRSPNLQRSTSSVGPKLHFNYTGKANKIESSQPESSHSKVTHHQALSRQSTVDNSFSYTTSLAPSTNASTINRYDPKPSYEPTTHYEQTKSRSKTESSVSYEPPPNTVSQVPNYYGQIGASFPVPHRQQSFSQVQPHPKKDVTVATFPSPRPQIKEERTTSLFTPSKSPVQQSYRNTPYLFSSHNLQASVLPVEKSRSTSSYSSLKPEASNPYTGQHSPSSGLIFQSSLPSTNQFYTMLSHQTTDISPRVPSTLLPTMDQTRPNISAHQPLIGNHKSVMPEKVPSLQSFREPPSTRVSSGKPPPLLRQSSSSSYHPTPQSLSSHISVNPSRSRQQRNLTIGYLPQHIADIESAQRHLREETEKNEAESRARLQAQKKATDVLARMEERRKTEEAAKKAAEEAKRKGSNGEDDGEVEKFIQYLEERIKDSQNSKNLIGALAGRHITLNHVNLAENLTDAVMNKTIGTVETVEGHNADDQLTTQSVADSSEEYTFLQKIKNMKTDQNANRRKFAEHYYDFEDDDDSELNSSNSINSYLSTVTEEDADYASLNQSCIDNSQIETLPLSVINYIHNLVDGIFSLMEKSAINSDTQKYDNDDKYYTTNSDTNYNYQVISEDAKQFFTPKNSSKTRAEEN